MKQFFLIFIFGVFSMLSSSAQQTLIKGSVKQADSFEPISEVTITIEETQQTTLTNEQGEFEFSSNVPLGE
ncbi:MAG: carboxypeptidase-like regulatory domain-containing protein, partial [Flavobacteriaceae bacterium]